MIQTAAILAAGGFHAYLPTAVHPSRRHILALEGAPEDADSEGIVLCWATERADEGEEFLVAFANGPSKLRIIRVHQGTRDALDFDVDHTAAYHAVAVDSAPRRR